MRMAAVEHALTTLERLQVDYHTANSIDVGGTKQVWLSVPRRTPVTFTERLKQRIGQQLGVHVPIPTTEVIVTDNPLLTRVPRLQFFDRGFNTEALGAEVDTTGDFLREEDVRPFLDTFDLIFCFDTLEHVSDPFTFCRNLVRIAQPGGVIYLATVFSWEYHPSPQDYYRFSPEGLRECFARTEGEVLACGWDTPDISVYICVRRPVIGSIKEESIVKEPNYEANGK
jgi:SAM-dependent methyltransferase